MTLMTKAQYSRVRGVSRQAISRFVRDWGIATHGPRGLIDAEELDGLYYPRIDAGTAPWFDSRAAELGRARKLQGNILS